MTEDLRTIIETVSAGNSLKITAIDALTGMEATVICPKNTTKLQREQLAIQKLKYVSNKKKAESSNDSDSNNNLF